VFGRATITLGIGPHSSKSTEMKNVFLLAISNKLECGPMPNVMAALPNIGGALCSTP